jgi:hypothetical protein
MCVHAALAGGITGRGEKSRSRLWVLMSQHQDLDLLRLVRAGEPHYEFQDPPQGDVRERPLHTRRPFQAITVSAATTPLLTGIDRINEPHRVQTCRRELLDRTLIWNQHHLLHAVREFEAFYNTHRPHRSVNGVPLRPAPQPLSQPSQLQQLAILRRDRLGGVLHEYQHAAAA